MQIRPPKKCRCGGHIVEGDVCCRSCGKIFFWEGIWNSIAFVMINALFILLLRAVERYDAMVVALSVAILWLTRALLVYLYARALRSSFESKSVQHEPVQAGNAEGSQTSGLGGYAMFINFTCLVVVGILAKFELGDHVLSLLITASSVVLGVVVLLLLLDLYSLARMMRQHMH